MKSSDFFEIIGEIDINKIAQAANALKKRKQPVFVKWAALAACLTLAVALSIPAINNLHQIGIPKSDIVEYIEKKESQKIGLAINKVDSIISADIDLKYSSLLKNMPFDTWQAILNTFYETVGISYENFTALVPDSWECSDFYSLSTPVFAKDDTARKKYSIHDYVFDYKEENGGKITIAMCNFEEPLRDYFIKCDNPTQSQLNGVPLVIYEYENIYIAQFSYNNVNYDIEAENIGLGELSHFLSSLFTLPGGSSSDVSADSNGKYMEAFENKNLTGSAKDIFGGSYLDENGNFVIVLTSNTEENRASICKQLGINEADVTFKTGTYSLDYLTKLQDKISTAMQNRELPFVTSSGVYENINKIKVTVTTNDEDKLLKLKSLDSLGGAIETEFSDFVFHELTKKDSECR